MLLERGTMTKTEFEELYKKHTIKELCKMFNCCAGTIFNTLKRYDIPLKGNVGRRNSLKLKLED